MAKAAADVAACPPPCTTSAVTALATVLLLTVEIVPFASFVFAVLATAEKDPCPLVTPGIFSQGTTAPIKAFLPNSPKYTGLLSTFC